MNRKIRVWFGKGSWKFLNEWKDNLLSLSDLLDNRKQRILNTIRNSEELREGPLNNSKSPGPLTESGNGSRSVSSEWIL